MTGRTGAVHPCIHHSPIPSLLPGAAALAAVFGAMFGVVHPSLAAGTSAGTTITNTAQVSYIMGGNAAVAQSNTTSTAVLQVLNVVATVQTPSVAVASGDQNRALTFRITNTGNGPDIYLLSAQSGLPGDNFNPVLATPASIYLDTDNNGVFSAGDTAYVPGASVALAADAAATVFVLNSIPVALSTGSTGRSQISAVRTAGAGTPGQTLIGGGVGGVDAVFGGSGDQVQKAGQYVIANSVTLAAVKSQIILDPRGGTRPVSGATITYTIAVTANGTGTVSAAQFTDAIPPGTLYKSASLTLNGAALTDLAGDDAGQYLTAPNPRISVLLGDLTQASGVQTVTFTVTII